MRLETDRWPGMTKVGLVSLGQLKPCVFASRENTNNNAYIVRASVSSRLLVVYVYSLVKAPTTIRMSSDWNC
jgi:hypothetical protein